MGGAPGPAWWVFEPAGPELPETAAAAIVAFLVCLAVTPVAIRAGRRWKRLLDNPGGRKRHPTAVPRTGGIAVAGGLSAGFAVAFVLGAFSSPDASPAAALPFVVSTAVVFTVGLIDDARGCSVAVKLLAQGAAALLLVAAGHVIDVVSTPFGPAEVGRTTGTLVTVVWLVGVTNAINLMDGLDGLAGGVAAIVAGSLAVFAGVLGDSASLAIALALCGACAGFLPYNRRPARVFLGDAGSLTVGFVLAWLSLTASLKATTVVAVFVPVLVLGVPAADTLLVMHARFMVPSSAGFFSRVRKMVQADRRHLHHRVADATEYRTGVLVVYGVVAAGCLLALLAVVRNSPPLAAVTLLVEIGVVAVLRRLRPREAAGASSPAGGVSGAGRAGIEPASPKR